MEKPGLLCCLILVSWPGVSSQSPGACGEVRKVFQLKQIGALKSAPETPISGSNLQVCMSPNLTCCTKKMEERYQIATQKDVQNLLRMSSSRLKFLMSRNVAAFQEMFKALTRQAENYTNSVFHRTYRNMASETKGPVRELFTDIGLFVLGSELGLDAIIHRFYDGLFPPVYNHLINPGLTDISSAYAKCVRSVRRELKPFGSFPRQLAEQIRQSILPGRIFLQALNVGIEVINTTAHSPSSKECKRSLLKMLYCPHCQGLTHSKPCMGYCLNVMRGCLASIEEIDGHWREFIRSLEEASDLMYGANDLEKALLGVYLTVDNAVVHAQRNGPRLSAQVHGVCGHPDRKPVHPVSGQHDNDSISTRILGQSTQKTFNGKRKEFITSLRFYRTFYAVLADQLCVSKLASGDGTSCWNGIDVVKSYTRQVVGSGIKAQAKNPEVRAKAVDPVMHQIINKLKHVSQQLLQGKAILTNGMLDLTEKGSGDSEWHFSGNCDDEDGCAGSGDGEAVKVSKPRTPDKVSHGRESGTRMKTVKVQRASAGGRRASAALLTLALISIVTHLRG